MSQRQKSATENEDERGEPDLDHWGIEPASSLFGGSTIDLGAGSTVDLGAGAESSIDLEGVNTERGPSPSVVPANSSQRRRDDRGDDTTRTARGDSSDQVDRDASDEALRASRRDLAVEEATTRAGTPGNDAEKDKGGGADRKEGGGEDVGGRGDVHHSRSASVGGAGAATVGAVGEQLPPPRPQQLAARKSGDGRGYGVEGDSRARSRELPHQTPLVGSSSTVEGKIRRGGSPRRSENAHGGASALDGRRVSVAHRTISRTNADFLVASIRWFMLVFDFGVRIVNLCSCLSSVLVLGSRLSLSMMTQEDVLRIIIALYVGVRVFLPPAVSLPTTVHGRSCSCYAKTIVICV